MKKAVLILLFISFQLQNTSVFADKASYTPPVETINNKEVTNLVLLGKIWGLLKYHHPAIIKGTYNWDQELIKFLPGYQSTQTIAERNQLLISWIRSFGPVPVASPMPDSLLVNAKLLPDYSWIDKSNLSPELSGLLMQISNCHSTGDQRYVKFLEEDNIVLPAFINEDSYAKMTYPATGYRLLAIYRYWNIIEYWYPYKYLAKQKWADCLALFIKNALAAGDEVAYTRAVQKMIGLIQDSHAVVNSKKIEELKGKWLMPFTIKFIQNEAVIISVDVKQLNNAGINAGDILKAVNGIPVKELVKREKPYLSASNNAVVLREMARLLNRSTDSVTEVSITGQTGITQKLTVKNVLYVPRNIVPVYDFAYQRDSSCFLLPSGIIYVNAGKFKDEQMSWIKQHLPGAKGLLLDARQYPRTGAGAVIDLLQSCLLPDKGAMSKFSSVVKDYPGLFRYVAPFSIGQANSDYYKGKVGILVNEETQSTSEFLTMAYQLAPKAFVVGSTTAGADGNVTYPFALPGGIITMMTGLGVYYPDGKETQQVGIIPNVKVEQTINGFREHKDELLDKAISVIVNN